jgi:voltage-gated potassium channel
MKLRQQLYTIIFGTDTPAGKLFDLILIYAIVISVVFLMMDSVVAVNDRWGYIINYIEWFFTIAFTLEYGVRIYSSPARWRYIRSFFGVIDLLSILPAYVSVLIPGANYLLMLRLVRVLRVFRVLKLMRYINEGNFILRSMFNARHKILVFFLAVLVIATIFGSIMYMVEGPENGFTSIPRSIYWTIVTITTVGYGDITPQTTLGQIVASAAMLTGYSIIVVPTGIITAEFTQEIQRERNLIACPKCGKSGHDKAANFCHRCGSAVSNPHKY